MAVHAHPDDEASSTGGVLAAAAAAGIRTVVVTCTDGSCGDAPGGAKPGDPGHDPAAVVALRRTELEASRQALKVDAVEWLGYADSGMMGWQANQAPDSFWQASVDDAAAKLGELFTRYQPDVVVTYDPDGFYGHPDHIQAHRVTMRAVELTGIPKKVYWTTAPRSMMERFDEILREVGFTEWDEPDLGEDGERIDIGLPDEEITTWVDISQFAEQKFASLAAHASQSENIFFLRMGLDRFTEVMGVETFVRVHDTTGAALPESDLFAGLL
jgi:LmbE family N-acetylglucosaminyl deacetylase